MDGRMGEVPDVIVCSLVCRVERGGTGIKLTNPSNSFPNVFVLNFHYFGHSLGGNVKKKGNEDDCRE